jgi:hypothetical protein
MGKDRFERRITELVTLVEKSPINVTPATGLLGGYDKWTIYVETSGANNITVELSPDGTNYYEISESPFAFSAAGEKVQTLNYVAKNIKLTGNSGTGVTAFVRAVW